MLYQTLPRNSIRFFSKLILCIFDINLKSINERKHYVHKIACLRNDNDIITDLCNSIENVLKIVATFLNKQMVDAFENTAKICHNCFGQFNLMTIDSFWMIAILESTMNMIFAQQEVIHIFLLDELWIVDDLSNSESDLVDTI